MKKKVLVFVSALAACALLVSACLSASADGRLLRLVEAANALLFETENVTLTGHAEFRLDGERFKTADAKYMQDYTYSHWQLDLLTPRPGGEDRETGYTVIANGEKFYTMEKYRPGRYGSGFDQPQSTLVRRSTASDLLVSMGRAFAGPVEALLLPDAVTAVSESAEGTELKIRFTQDTVPAMLSPLLNQAAQFAVRRFMGIDYDRLYAPFRDERYENYATVTAAILGTTVSFDLADTDVTVRLDGENRITAASGTVSVILHSELNRDKKLEIGFDVQVSDYGNTIVKNFSPDAWNVIPMSAV